MSGRALLQLASLLLVGCADGPVPVAKNALLIVVDTLRWDHTGVYGAERDTTPELDDWAADSVLFERAYAAAPWTKASVGSLFTGLYPTAHGAQKGDDALPQQVDTLAEVLARNGFDTIGVVSHSLLDEKWGFAQGFGEFHDDQALGHEHVSTEGVTRRALEILERRASEPGRFFLFVHYFDPHYQFQRHPEVGFAAERAGNIDGTEPFETLRAARLRLSEEQIELLRALYDEEIRHTDAGIGRLLARLDELNLAHETAVVFTSDHGEEFMERNWLGHTRTLYEELVRVPLAVRAPGVVPHSVAEPVSLVSVMPTLLDLLGVEAPALRFEARSLAPVIRGGEPGDESDERDEPDEPDEPDDWVFTEVDYVPIRGKEKRAFKKAVVGPRFKLIEDDRTGRLELYDLRDDAGETRNLADTHETELAHLRARLRSHVEREIAAVEASPTPDLEADEIERLRGLGYVEEP